jgi:hypothetical protein
VKHVSLEADSLFFELEKYDSDVYFHLNNKYMNGDLKTKYASPHQT